MQFNHNNNIKKQRMDEYYDSELRIVLNNTGRNPFGKGCSSTFGEMWKSRRNLLQLTKNLHRLICNTDRQNWLSSKLWPDISIDLSNLMVSLTWTIQMRPFSLCVSNTQQHTELWKVKSKFLLENKQVRHRCYVVIFRIIKIDYSKFFWTI